MPSSILERTVRSCLALLPFCAVVAMLMLTMDYAYGRSLTLSTDGLMGVFVSFVPRFFRLWLLAGFALLIWTEATGRTDRPRWLRILIDCKDLLVLAVLWSVGLHFLFHAIELLAGRLPDPALQLGTILVLETIRIVLVLTFLATAAGGDFMAGLQKLGPTLRRGWIWALGLALVHLGVALYLPRLLARLPLEMIQPAAFVVGLGQDLCILFLLAGLVHSRLDREAAEAAKENIHGSDR